jgi:hypothetical protein
MSSKYATLPRRDGEWWIASGRVSRTCPHCGHVTRDWPAVLAYDPDMDSNGYCAHKHPNWPRYGWLAWWECAGCGGEWYSPTGPKQIAQWGQSLGGWRHE